MFDDLTRRDFIKAAAMSFVAVNATGLLPDEKVFAASDCIVKTRYGAFSGFMARYSVCSTARRKITLASSSTAETVR